MTLLKIDRWLLNHVFNRRRIFTIFISDCIDEFGNSFGKNGNHFFIRALKYSEDFNSVSNYLREYYAENRIHSFNDMVGRDIGSEEGKQYFCPWENDRVRPLEKFIYSHKIGPTDKKAIPSIVTRLLTILNSIKKKKIPSWASLDGYPSVIKIIDKKHRIRFLVRDGNHRLSVLSYLGSETVQVCFEDDYWQPSTAFLWLRKLLKKQDNFNNQNHPRIVRESDVNTWPHVKDGLVKPDDALKFFHTKFGECFDSTPHNRTFSND